MRIWIDLANSPHVPFFKVLIPEFQNRGHEVELSARDFAETVALSKAAGLKPQVIGEHGGKAISGKFGNLFSRARALRSWARDRNFDCALSHNSYSQILCARTLRMKIVTLMDYEHQPANHLAFRFASRVIVPETFPEASLRRYGAASRKVMRYHGTKEDVYLGDFKPDPEFPRQLASLGISAGDVLLVIRPPALEALYHRFENELFDELLDWLASQSLVKIILLPRNETQRAAYAGRASARLLIPSAPLDGQNLIAASDLVISAGGTMNREAAALGTPAATIYAGRWAAVDEDLRASGRLIRISRREDFFNLSLKKRSAVIRRRASGVKDEVVRLILGESL